MKKNFFLKFSIVAVAVGVLSPSVNFIPEVTEQGSQVSVSQLHISLFAQAEARRDGARARKGGGAKRNKNVNRNRNRNVNKNKNVNKNVNANVNVNKNVDVNVNHHHRRHYGHYHGRPLVGFATGLVVGTMVAASTMPTTCTVVSVNGIKYKRCGNAYYQPIQEGDIVVYKVVNSPL